MSGRRQIIPVLAMASTIATLSAASDPKKDFAASWEGQAVVLKQRLHTLAYKERGRLGNGTDKRDGLFVVTPFNGTYYQFDGRQSKDDIRGADPQTVADAIHAAYAGDALDVRPYAKVEPIVLTIYEPGVELIVSSVHVERDRLRLFFTDPRTPESTPATSFMIQWPTPFSRTFSERPAVEAIIGQYIQKHRVGTAYLLCPEATTSAVHRAALRSEAARHTALTNLFSGRPARGLVNRPMREPGLMSPVVPDFPMASPALAPLRAKADSEGRGDFSALWSGQNATGCGAIPAGDLTRALAPAVI